MKKLLSFLFVAIILIFGVTACNQKKNDDIVVSEKNDYTQDKAEEATVDKEQTDKDKPTKFTIYFGNEDATGFLKEEIEAAEVTPEILLDNLTKKGVITSDAKVLSLKETTKDGVKALELDFSKDFNTHLNTLGTSGEYITIGSICNTFLDAYECEKVRITVAGEILETGHAEYPGYMGRFD